MNFHFVISIVVFLLFPCISTMSQIDIETDLDSEFYQLRSKNYEDFIGRFNYSSDSKGNPLIYHDSLYSERAEEITRLFSPALYHNASRDTSIRDLLMDFTNKVTDKKKPIFLNLIAPDWYAELDCKIKYKKEDKKAKLFLSLFFDKKQKAVKWVIDSCRASFFELSVSPEISISPVSHNMNFMQIGKISDTNPDKFASLAYGGFKQDYLSMWFYAMCNEELKIDFVEKIIFHNYQIPEYYFTIENYIADQEHSGWLINTICKVTEKETTEKKISEDKR